VAAALAWTCLGPGGARAVPVDDPHIGGIGFSGPTTGDLAAVYWNPAALGLLHGQNMMFSGVGRLATTLGARGARRSLIFDWTASATTLREIYEALTTTSHGRGGRARA
jgi:hypothetical protein